MRKNTLIILLFLNIIFLRTYSDAQTADTRRFRFVVMGYVDLNNRSLKDYEFAIQRVKEVNPDLVLLLGYKITDSNKNVPEESILQEFNRIGRQLEVPIYNIHSECALASLSVPQDKIPLTTKKRIARTNKRFYSFEHKNSLFIFLDSSSLIKQKNGLIDKEQLDFLKGSLNNAHDFDNVFLTTQDSFWLQNDTQWLKVIHPLLANKVKFVFGSNMPHLNKKVIDNINYISTGYIPFYQKGQNGKQNFPHFLIVDVNKDNVNINIVPLKPISFEDVGISQKEERIVTYAIPQLNKYNALNLEKRQMILDPCSIIENLNIKSNMNILDIGAGSGIFTFRFAEALKGTGKVFATEIDPEMIKYIKGRLKMSKYKNIFPVYVAPERLDPFYKQHNFDIIFICELYHILSHIDNYFQELASSLKQETGRLYIISFKNISNFSEVEFGDFKDTFKILVYEGQDFPIFKRLSQVCQYYIRNWQGEDIPLEIRTKFILDLNKLLPDRFLFNEMLDYYAVKENNTDRYLLLNNLDVYDLRLVQWLAANLDKKGILDSSNNLSEIDKRELLKLNRILITGIFKSTAVESVKGVYTIFAEKNSIISTLEKAGYQFLREYDSLTQYYFLEFKRRSQGI